MSQTAISDAYRAEQADLNRRAAARLARVFPSLNFRDIDASAPGWILAVERIGADLHLASQSLAKEAYLSYRRDAGVQGTVEFILPDGEGGKLRASLLNEGPYAAKHLLSGGKRITDAARTVFSNTTGHALQWGQAGGRDLISTTVQTDRRAVGYKRIARSTACRFCRMLADRGAVYREPTVFASHPHCQCSAVPVFRGGEVGPEATAEQYIASRRPNNAKERERLRDFLALYGE